MGSQSSESPVKDGVLDGVKATVEIVGSGEGLEGEETSSLSQSQTSCSKSSSKESLRRGNRATHGRKSRKRSRSKTKTRSSRRSSKDPKLKIVQVANIAPQVTREQMQSLFGFVGKIKDISLYPSFEIRVPVGSSTQSKIGFVKFSNSASVKSAQHLTNTVFMDRALIVIPYHEADIPDEAQAMELLSRDSIFPGIIERKLPQHVTSQVQGSPPLQVIATHDPRLQEENLPAYPPLPPTLEFRVLEEIRRTVIICNLSPDLTADEVMDFFSSAGEVMYFRFCERDNDPLHYALLEFTNQPAVLKALHLNGQLFGGKVIRVYHATQAIIKPHAKSDEVARKEIEDAMSRHTEKVFASIQMDNLEAKASTSRKRSRSRGKDLRMSLSNSDSDSRGRRTSSRSRHRHRSHRRHRTRSRSADRSPVVRIRRRPHSKRRRRSRSRDKRRRSRTPS